MAEEKSWFDRLLKWRPVEIKNKLETEQIGGSRDVNITVNSLTLNLSSEDARLIKNTAFTEELEKMILEGAERKLANVAASLPYISDSTANEMALGTNTSTMVEFIKKKGKV